jgi:hypothetical protein
MNDALIGTGVNHPRENKSVVEGGGEAEDLSHLVLQDKLVVALEQHISLFNQYIFHYEPTRIKSSYLQIDHKNTLNNCLILKETKILK